MWYSDNHLLQIGRRLFWVHFMSNYIDYTSTSSVLVNLFYYLRQDLSYLSTFYVWLFVKDVNRWTRILSRKSLIIRCCIYLTTYDWIKSFLKITIEGRAIYGNLENKINTLCWPVEHSIPKNNDKGQSHIWKSRVANVFPLNTPVIKLPPQYSV